MIIIYCLRIVVVLDILETLTSMTKPMIPPAILIIYKIEDACSGSSDGGPVTVHRISSFSTRLECIPSNTHMLENPATTEIAITSCINLRYIVS
jgi:hypothetical protein